MKPKRSWWWLALALAMVGMVGVGCLTPQQQEWTCERARDVYTAYQAAEASGVVQDPQVIAGARIAAAFLSSYCGWENPRTRGMNSPPLIDTNGVLVVHPVPR